MPRQISIAVVLLFSGVLLLLQGCATPGRLSAVPVKETTRATIPDIPNARFWVDSDLEPMIRETHAAIEREQASWGDLGHHGALPPAYFLAVSGGGDDGAFGAGLLVGWTKAGDRPQFKLVTGVSTGALIAPFAFLGPEYDDVLRAVYTNVAPKDIATPRGWLSALTDDAIADNQPLLVLIGQYVNEAFLARIAEEYQKGRLLLIGTTNLDARRPVVWNMGAIAVAAKDHPKALELFRKIMLASAAIPGAFPPTMIDVEVDGQPYQEMHVDGGATRQLFLYPARLSDAAQHDHLRVFAQRPRTAYIIRNARLDPEWSSVERSALTIVGRAISSLIQTQGVGDLDRLYLVAQKDGLDFNLAYIGADFNAEHQEDFDTAYMRALFDYGYRLGSKGYPWQKTPPGLTAGATP
ncbi:MAG: patatin family protein [Candidatus Competibacteraceae bacterium]|nr:MAG: patatin family protein [Candidatus Competibacteraceae bacterium]